MSYRTGIAVLIIYVIGLATSTIRTNAIASDSLCIEGCMPICLRLDGASNASCEKGCALGCEQLKGKGRNYVLPATEDNNT